MLTNSTPPHSRPALGTAWPSSIRQTPEEAAARPHAARPAVADHRKRQFGLAAWVFLLAFGFRHTLFSLAELAVSSSLHSHILLVPLISAYLLYLRRDKLPTAYQTSLVGFALLLFAGVAAWFLAAGSPVGGAMAPRFASDEARSVRVLAFVCLLAAGGFFFLGRRWMTVASFPVAFLGFLIPLPDSLANGLETAFKLASAEAAGIFFSLSGTPVLRNGVIFELPNIVIEVAQECSGIRSSFVLFLTSLLAAHLFLRSPWRRALLVLLVFPLGILRNGFRILVIGLLCVHVGPHMIDSAIHHRGGPLFFALSLIPLFLLLWWLRRGDNALPPSETGLSQCREKPTDASAATSTKI